MLDCSANSPTKKEQRCVVIVGAGASVPLHVPAHAHLLDRLNRSPSAEESERGYMREADTYLEENPEFKNNLRKIQKQLTRPWKKKPNLETILTVIRVVESIDISKIKILEPLGLPYFGDIIKLINSFPEEFFDPYNIKEFEKQLYIFLKNVVYGNKGVLESYTKVKNPWSAFFNYCDGFKQVTWCSFNWDCLLESSFYRVHCDKHETMQLPNDIEPVTGSSPIEPSKRHKLLKLHGGINLWYDKGQTQIVHLLPGRPVNDQWNNYNENAYPIILEPSAFKYDNHVFKRIESHWKEFECVLNSANVIIIIGYSMPDFDEKARKILETAATENSSAAIIVFDPDSRVHRKYKKIFRSCRKVKKAKTRYGRSTEESIRSELTTLYDPAQ